MVAAVTLRVRTAAAYSGPSELRPSPGKPGPPDSPPSDLDSGILGCEFVRPSEFRLRRRVRLSCPPRQGAGRMIGVHEDTSGGASRLDQRESAWRNAILEESLSFAEHNRNDPEAVFVDELGGDKRLQQCTAAPDVKLRPIRCLQAADLVHDVTGYQA